MADIQSIGTGIAATGASGGDADVAAVLAAAQAAMEAAKKAADEAAQAKSFADAQAAGVRAQEAYDAASRAAAQLAFQPQWADALTQAKQLVEAAGNDLVRARLTVSGMSDTFALDAAAPNGADLNGPCTTKEQALAELDRLQRAIESLPNLAEYGADKHFDIQTGRPAVYEPGRVVHSTEGESNVIRGALAAKFKALSDGIANGTMSFDEVQKQSQLTFAVAKALPSPYLPQGLTSFSVRSGVSMATTPAPKASPEDLGRAVVLKSHVLANQAFLAAAILGGTIQKPDGWNGSDADYGLSLMAKSAAVIPSDGKGLTETQFNDAYYGTGLSSTSTPGQKSTDGSVGMRGLIDELQAALDRKKGIASTRPAYGMATSNPTLVVPSSGAAGRRAATARRETAGGGTLEAATTLEQKRRFTNVWLKLLVEQMLEQAEALDPPDSTTLELLHRLQAHVEHEAGAQGRSAALAENAPKTR